MLISAAEPDRVPPGPWVWETCDLGGVRLVAGDGTVLLEVDDGYGSPDLYNRAIERLLRDAWKPKLDGAGLHEHDGPMAADEDNTIRELMQLVDQVADLTRQRDDALAERDDARRWARGYESGMWLFDTTDPPDWLIDRFDENGDPVDAEGNSVEGDPRLF